MASHPSTAGKNRKSQRQRFREKKAREMKALREAAKVSGDAPETQKTDTKSPYRKSNRLARAAEKAKEELQNHQDAADLSQERSSIMATKFKDQDEKIDALTARLEAFEADMRRSVDKVNKLFADYDEKLGVTDQAIVQLAFDKEVIMDEAESMRKKIRKMDHRIATTMRHFRETLSEERAYQLWIDYYEVLCRSEE